MTMRRGGGLLFARRIFRSFFNGLFMAKARRHVLKMAFVNRSLVTVLKALFPVDVGKVVCATFSGAMECNPKYIAAELRRRGGWRIVWLLGAHDYRRHADEARQLGYRAAPFWSLRGFYHAVTAAVWIDNAQSFAQLGFSDKRDGQRYLNTWHGSLGIKRLDTADEKVRARVEKMAKMVDAVTVNSDFEEGVFKASIFPQTAKLRVGHPRNDVFFLPDAERAKLRDRVRAELGLSAEERFALYAPTFREVAFFADAGGLGFGNWARALESRFGGRWRIVVRLHPHDAKGLAEGLFSLPEGVQDASAREDIQELLVAADAGITDYSSWIFDYLLGGGPGFIYAPDKRDYDASRGFCYPLEETPFPIAETEESLCENVRAFDSDTYSRRRQEFLNRRGCYEDGRASERAADLVERWLDETCAGGVSV